MKTLGLDLGTNSIGWAIRNTILYEENVNQIEKFGVTIFEKGVGEGKSGEFSFAAQRTKKRSTRRLYQARKYRLWKTLEILIEHEFCPLKIESLNRWRKYDKSKALQGEGGRAYPIDDIAFDAWIKLDFNGDGKPDYKSPYELRAELIEKKIDLTKEIERHKIGRALYHIAQRRGFKSSRKDAVADDAGDRQDAKSEQTKETEFENNFQKKFGKSLADFPTIGSALAFVQKQGERVRLEWIQHTFRKHYKNECTKIFEFHGLGTDSKLYIDLIESKKNRYDGSIFKQRPLRSQKGLIGTCTLEQCKYKDTETGKIIISGKPRCPISHFEFEEFRALSFLNNIQIKKDGEWVDLSSELKAEIYDKLFFRPSKPYFSFSEIREFIEKRIGEKLFYRDDKEKGYWKNINYSDKTNVSACPVSGRLKIIFGEEWKNFRLETGQKRKNKNGKEHNVIYTIDDVWHILFSFDNEESVEEFVGEKLNIPDKVDKFITAWKKLPDGYGMLSLNAIKKINEFLREGFIYTEAVLLANIPEIIGKDIWKDTENQNLIKDNITKLIDENRQIKQILVIVNNLTAKYKSLHDSEKYGYKDTNYILTESDKNEILTTIIEYFGETTWETKVQNKTAITETVYFLYQATFRNGFETISYGEDRYHIIKYNQKTYLKSSSHQFYKLPRVVDTITDFIRVNFAHVSEKQLAKLYHPSMIEIYAPAHRDEKDGKIYLQSPKTGAFKNPMAMRTLHELRKLINYLIETGQIDEETRIVVETARELNDSNKRWAIEAYQRQRQIENNEFTDAIRGLLENKDYTTQPNPENSDDIDKVRLWYEQVKTNQISKGKGEYTQNKLANQSTELFQNLIQAKSLIDKYRLWKEQKCICIYTGRTISISDLFDENKIDFEHTIPRSISFDNSLANLTVCFANYNRNIKKNQIPTKLPNYEHDALEYTAIKPRLKEWEDKVEHLKSMIEFWKGKSKSASTKDYKDDAIRQRHLWQMELDYWRNKLERFTMTEVKTGFKNSQLVDTQLISKYALHYMRTAFNTVDVQKGTITADFRKILGIQATYEKKSRAKHSHHAIDAAVLTFIPHAAKREKILKYFYEIRELEKLVYENRQREKLLRLEDEFKKEVTQLDLPKVNEIINTIDNQILINNIARDQALVPSKKIVRNRGKVVFLRDKNNKKITDENDKPKPKIAQGDCIRGQLHLDSFYGKIKVVKRDEDGKPLKGENGEWINIEKNDGFGFVKRKQKDEITNLNQIVDPYLRKIIAKQLNGRSIEKAIAEGVYMLDRKGKPVGKQIRHIRCWADTSNPIPIKKQSHVSKTNEYKNSYYAANAENTLYAYYWDGKSKERGFECLNLFQVASIRKMINPKRLEDYFAPFKELGRGKVKIETPIYAVLKPGTKVMFFREYKEELKELNISDRLKRLYKISRLYDAISGRIMFDFHIEARTDEELTKAFPKETFGQRGKNGFSEFNYEFTWPRLLMSPSSFNFLIEGKDFEIKKDGEILFFNLK
jgi:CRISPR-associated endonuclease Csn1